MPDPSKDVSDTPLFGTFTCLTKIPGLRRLWPFKKDSKDPTDPNHPNGPDGPNGDLNENPEDDDYVPMSDIRDSDSDIATHSLWRRRRGHFSRASSPRPS
jgi:hypothetical protein